MADNERKEKPGQPEPQKKEDKDEAPKKPSLFSELLAAFREAVTQEQKQEARIAIEKRIEEFHRKTDYGRETGEKNQKLVEKLGEVLKELEGLSGEQLEEAREKAEEEISKAGEEAEKHIGKEPDDLPKEYKGISHYELSELITEGQERQRKTFQEKKPNEKKQAPSSHKQEDLLDVDEQGKNVEHELEKKGKRKLTDDESKVVEEDVMKDTEHINEFEKREKEIFRRGYHYGFSEEEQELIRTDPAEREKLFESLFSAADAQPQTDFWHSVDQDTGIKIGQFFRKLSDPSLGKEGRWLLNRYSTEFTLRRVLHDVAWGVEYGQIPPQKLPDYVTPYASYMVEFLFKTPWVSKAARLYEKAFEKLLDEDGFVNAFRVCLRPGFLQSDKDFVGKGELGGKSEVDEWVYKQLEDSLRIQGKLPQDPKEKEIIIRRAMALGKQHEIVTMRLVEISARGRLPDKGPGRLVSPWAEDYVRVFDPFEHFFKKFKTGEDALAIFYFFVTGKVVEGKMEMPERHAFLLREFERLRAEGNERMVDLMNILGAGGPATQSEWREILAAQNISDKDIRLLGTNLRLIIEVARLKNEIEEGKTGGYFFQNTKEEFLRTHQFSREYKEKLRKRYPQLTDEEISRRLKSEMADEKFLNEQADELIKFRKQMIWRDGVEVNPLQVLRESDFSDIEKLRKDDERRKLLEGMRHDLTPEVRDDLSLLSEIAVDQKADRINFDYIQDLDRRERARACFEKIENLTVGANSENERVLRVLAKKELKDFRLGLSTSDVSWELLEFSMTGPIGYLIRRIRDMSGAAVSRDNLASFLSETFPELKSPEAITHAIFKDILPPIKGYDSERAGEMGTFLTEGISRFYLSDKWVRHAPWPIGLALDHFRTNSAAEHFWGEEAMAWFKSDIRHFISVMAGVGALGPGSKDKAVKLFDKLTARRKDLLLEFGCRWTPLGLLIILGLVIKEIKDQVEETLKGN